MKKLLITSMAAVAVSICAKAEFTDTSEDFESKNIGPLFSQGEEGSEYEGQYIVDRSEWSTAATPDDGVFTVTNTADITTKDGYTLANGNTKALAIDTSASLMRNAITSGDDSQTGHVMAGDESIFFDSLVQFTATESIPTPSTGDKLVIGLFADEDPEVNADLGALDNATNLVVISAVLNQQGQIIANATNIIDNTDLNVGPEEWHRLTIQVMNNSGFSTEANVPGFKVFVDEEEVKVNGANQIFYSLVKYVGTGENVLKGVAFDGKGAVDDLVFTAEAPTFAGGGGEEPATYAINAQYVQDDVVVSFSYDEAGENGVEDPTSIDIEHSTVYLYIDMKSGATLTGVTVNETPVTNLPDYMDGNAYNILLSFDDPTPGTEYNVVINTTNSGSGGDPEVTEKPTVGDNTYDTGADLTAAVKSDMTITVPSGWSVDGKVLKDDKGDTFATFAPYYILTQDGLTVAVTLDQKAAAPFAEATDLTDGQEVFDLDETMEDESPAVGIHIKTYSGLWYGLGTATTLGGTWSEPAANDWVKGDGGNKQLKAKKPVEGNAAFFKIRVRDTDPAE